MESYEQGGLMGIWVNPEGFLMEGCVANVVSIKGNELRTPPFENILRGCTLRRVLEIAQGCGKLIIFFLQIFMISVTSQKQPRKLKEADKASERFHAHFIQKIKC